MSKKVFDQIAEGLEEALAVARGEDDAFRLHVPCEIDVKRIQQKTGSEGNHLPRRAATYRKVRGAIVPLNCNAFQKHSPNPEEANYVYPLPVARR